MQTIKIINLQIIWRCTDLANIKSAKKRVLVIETKTARNKAIKSRVKTFVKKVDAAVLAGDKEAATVALKDAISELNKAASKGVYHKNTVSRKVSRLTKAVNGIA
jgi:small subunit ribosomal protein S20